MKDQNIETLKQATQALALPFSEQRNLFPSFVNLGDELVLLFDEAYQHLEELLDQKKLHSAQADLFKSIDAYSEKLTKKHQQTNVIFTNDAVERALEWEKMRELAREALEAMGWESTISTINGVIYTQESNEENHKV